MLAPLVLLAVLSVVGGWIGVPQALGGSNHFEHYLAPVFESNAPTILAPRLRNIYDEHGVAPNPAESSGPSDITLTLAASGAGLAGFLLGVLPL